MKQRLLDLIQNIKFWILFFFLVHLSAITLPPLEPGSTWRQTDGLMIARNFYERNSNIFFPMVDVAGEKSGIVGSEFPILNYLICLISRVFGYESWYGRLINLMVSSIGIFFFYKLIRKYFGESPAFNASLIVLVSIWFTYCRTNIPDTFAASICIISVFFCTEYLEKGRFYQVLLFFILGLVGCLSKISSAAMLTVLAIPFFLVTSPWQRKAIVCLCSAVILVSVYCWYFVWVPYLNVTYGFEGHFFMGMSLSSGIHEILEKWKPSLKRIYDTALKYTGFVTFLISLIYIIKKKDWLVLLVFLVPFLAFSIVVVKSGANFQLNPYYVVMFVPPMAFVMGYALAKLRSKVMVAIILLIIGIEGVANQVHVLNIRQPYKSFENLEAIMDSVSQRDDLVAINGDVFGNPTPMYFAHRRGWALSNADLIQPEFLDYLKNNGCKYIVIVKKVFGADLDLEFPKVYDSEYFKVYKIPMNDISSPVLN